MNRAQRITNQLHEVSLPPVEIGKKGDAKTYMSIGHSRGGYLWILKADGELLSRKVTNRKNVHRGEWSREYERGEVVYQGRYDGEKRVATVYAPYESPHFGGVDVPNFLLRRLKKAFPDMDKVVVFDMNLLRQANRIA